MKKIRNILLVYYLIPVFALYLVTDLFFYGFAKRSLDHELSSRIELCALSIADQWSSLQLKAAATFSSGSESFKDLEQIVKQQQRKYHLTRIAILSPDGKVILSSDSLNAKGSLLPEFILYQDEIEQISTQRQPTSSILFSGKDGEYYKAGFASIWDEENLVGLVLVRANADFFTNLKKLTKILSYLSLFGAILIIAVSYLISFKIVRPLETLSQVANDIGFGKLDMPIIIKSQTELGFLGNAIEDMRKKLLKRDQELNLMMKGIAHEVRNPLAGMELYSQLLKDEIQDQKQRGYIERLRREIKYMQRMVNEFLEFAKGIQPLKNPTELNSLVKETIDYIYQEALQKGVEFKLNIEEHLTINVDADYIKRALSNILKNAIQASAQGQMVEIVGRQKNQGFELVVRDHGSGISAENLGLMFQPFFTTKEKGTGLGLALAQKLIFAHEGTIDISSTLGQGTIVTISIPNA